MAYSVKFAVAVFALALMGLLPRAQATTQVVYVGANTTVCPGSVPDLFYDQTSCTNATTITVGDTVQWLQQSVLLGDEHTSTSGVPANVANICFGDGNWNLPGSEPSNCFTTSINKMVNGVTTYTHTFNTPGTFPYYCIPHNNFMRGTVTVQASPNIVLTVTPNPSAYGLNVALTATVSYPSGPTPTGTVTFNIDGIAQSPSMTLSGGQASMNISTLSAGSHSIFFSYTTGDTIFLSGFSNNPTLTVNPAGTATSLVDNGPNPSVAGQTVSLTATVSNLDTSVTPTGIVTFTDDLGPSAMIALSGGAATWFPTTLLGGLNSITASFTDPSGNFNNSGSSAATQMVQNFQMAISNPLISVFPSQPATFNGTLSSLGSYPGTVTVTCTSVPVGVTCTPPGSPVANGSAIPFTVTASSATQGSYSFNLHGAGGGYVQDVPVNLNVSSFVVSIPSPATVTAVAGNPSGVTTFTITSQGTFNAPVTMSCGTPLPAGVTCLFSPSATVTPPPGGSVNVEVNFTTSTATPATNSIIVNGTSGTVVEPQTVTLNVTTGSGTFDVGVLSFTHVNTPDPVMVGGTVEFDVTVENFTTCPVSPCTDSAATTLLVEFNGPAHVISATMPSFSCPISGSTVTCSGTLTRAQTAMSTIKVAAPFQRTFAATFQVSSTSTDPDPTNNVRTDTALIRVRPLARKGLVPKQP